MPSSKLMCERVTFLQEGRHERSQIPHWLRVVLAARRQRVTEERTRLHQGLPSKELVREALDAAAERVFQTNLHS